MFELDYFRKKKRKRFPCFHIYSYGNMSGSFGKMLCHHKPVKIIFLLSVFNEINISKQVSVTTEVWLMALTRGLVSRL